MRVLPLLLSLLLVAGCLDSPAGGPSGGPATGATRPSSAPPAEAAPATATEEQGSISGIVVDDEQRPLERVNVAIVETLAEGLTDGEGRFTFNDLDPGQYSLVFRRLGYVDDARRVTVLAGEITEVNVVLTAQQILDSYYESIHKRAHIKNSYVFLTTFGSAANATGALSNLCDPCIFHLAYGKNLVEAKAEVHWPASGNPAINDEVFLQFYVNYQASSDGTAATTGYVKNRATLMVTESGIASMKKYESTRLRVNGGFYSLSLDHKPEIWTTFAYVDPLPEGHTALPPR